jgi:hypothetical protein
LFCFRFTDMERIPGDLEGDAFRLEFEVLNWTNRGAEALQLGANVGTMGAGDAAPMISGAGIDPDGRGGPLGGSDIGGGAFDPTAIHHGRGRGDITSALNDWSLTSISATSVQWDVVDFAGGSPALDGAPIPARNLLGSGAAAVSLVPGFGTDALGDSAVDGGPLPYAPPSPGGGPDPAAGGNVLDGFVLDVDDWDVGEVFSLNWFLAARFLGSSGFEPLLVPIGTSAGGNDFGFGTINLVRLDPTPGLPPASLPGPVLIGNTGFNQSLGSFYDTVYEIPNPAEFAAEFGAGITAPFLNPGDNVFNVPVNTDVVPEPGTVILLGMGISGGLRIRRKRDS